jgi:hypothetical protein
MHRERYVNEQERVSRLKSIQPPTDRRSLLEWPYLPAQPEGFPEFLRTSRQMVRYFSSIGRRDVMIPEIVQSGWSRCYGPHHADDRTRWHKAYDGGVMNLRDGFTYCSIQCATDGEASKSNGTTGARP